MLLNIGFQPRNPHSCSKWKMLQNSLLLSSESKSVAQGNSTSSLAFWTRVLTLYMYQRQREMFVAVNRLASLGREQDIHIPTKLAKANKHIDCRVDMTTVPVAILIMTTVPPILQQWSKVQVRPLRMSPSVWQEDKAKIGKRSSSQQPSGRRESESANNHRGCLWQ